MASWSPENATNAYITTLKMEGREEPNVAAFISALAAGNNAQLMVTTSCALNNTVNPSLLLALVAAAHQTGGQVICILPTLQDLHSTKHALQSSDVDDANKLIEFVVGDPSHILLGESYKEADFLLIDCNLPNYEEIIESRKGGERKRLIVGYNAFSKGASWQWSGLGTQLLPIGDGLLVTKLEGHFRDFAKNERGEVRRKSNWIVKVDKCTGEEHVFRVRSPHKKLQVAV